MFHSHSLFEMMRCQVFCALSPMKERELMSICVCACRYITAHTGKLLTCIFKSERLMMSWFPLWGWMYVVIMYVTSSFLMNTSASDLPPEHFCLSSAAWTLQTQFWLISVSILLHNHFCLSFAKFRSEKNGFFSIHECEFELNWQQCTGSWIEIFIGLTGRRIY